MREDAEWIETDGLGGFASGTEAGIRTRRYHALLLSAVTPPTGRVVLVNGVEAWVDTPQGRRALTTQRYAPDVLHPDGASRIASFTIEPWPTWTFRLDDGTEIVHEVIASHGSPTVALSWRLATPRPGITLSVRLLMSGRDTHALQRENAVFSFEPTIAGDTVRWQPYADRPAVLARSNGDYHHEPVWYRNFFYTEEAARGLDCIEDLASPGVLTFDLSAAEGVCVLSAAIGEAAVELRSEGSTAVALRQRLVTRERRRRRVFPSALHRAADAYIVQRGEGKTIIAGYPWFSDWGRDTFIALRGLAIAGDRLEDARRILVQWASAVSEGMLPNFFPEGGQAPEYNSVDASLWYIIAVHELRLALEARGTALRSRDSATLTAAVQAILDGFARGTRFNIHLDADGLLAAGASGVQLTWMDAKVGDWVVTPRIGKPVEVQALWINALHIGAASDSRWDAIRDRAQASFLSRFWDPSRGYLADVVDADHVAGRVDDSLRPNQLFAIGGLPVALVAGPPARRVVDVVEQRLWTPLGPRSLAPGSPGYAPHYTGGVWQRDGAYHQGTVWPWLSGAFVEAWLRVHGDTTATRREARQRFLAPLLAHLSSAGLGHVSEIADADPPFTPRGCPFQAWSVGEVLRLAHGVLAESRDDVTSTSGAPLAVGA